MLPKNFPLLYVPGHDAVLTDTSPSRIQPSAAEFGAQAPASTQDPRYRKTCDQRKSLESPMVTVRRRRPSKLPGIPCKGRPECNDTANAASLRANQSMIEDAPKSGTTGDCNNLVSFTFSGDCDDEKPILIDASDTKRTVSRRTAYQLVTRLAGAFNGNSTVCMHLGNDILYPVLVLAILASQCRWTGTNTAYTAAELEHHFRSSETDYVITTDEHLVTVREAVQASGRCIEVIAFADLLDTSLSTASSFRRVFDGVSSTKSGHYALRTLRDLLDQPSRQGLDDLLSGSLPDDTAALMQTSGTTGLPKIAVRTHRSMMAELQAIADDPAVKPYEVRRLFCTPAFHAFSAPEMLFNAIRLGHVSYFMRRYDDTFAQRVHDLGVTEIFGAPAMLLRLANRSEDRSLLQTLRYVAYGGSPLGAGLRKRFLDIFHLPPRLVPVYGMTEGGWFTTLKYPEDDDTGSVGRPVPSYEIKLSTKSLTRIEGHPSAGEVLVRGPQVMKGYLGNAPATADAFDDGWLKTGDIGYLENGKHYLIDRDKDMMKVNGWQVSPVELQSVLMQSEDALEAAVYGAGHGEDEHPVAWIIRRRASVTAEAIMRHLRSSLASYKVRSCEVRFVDEIPKSSTGKVSRERLKTQAYVM